MFEGRLRVSACIARIIRWHIVRSGSSGLQPGNIHIDLFGTKYLFRRLFEIAKVIQGACKRFGRLCEGSEGSRATWTAPKTKLPEPWREFAWLNSGSLHRRESFP